MIIRVMTLFGPRHEKTCLGGGGGGGGVGTTKAQTSLPIHAD